MARRHPEDCMCMVCTAARKKSRASASTTRRATASRGRSSSKSRASSARRASSSARSTRHASTRSRASSSRAASKTTSRASRKTSTRGAAAHPLTDHDEIRRWAEERGAHPACVRRTGGSKDIGMIRLDFPGYSGADSLEPVSWEDWFRKFDESGLALLVQDKTSRGQKSNFNKLVSRQTVRRAA